MGTVRLKNAEGNPPTTCTGIEDCAVGTPPADRAWTTVWAHPDTQNGTLPLKTLNDNPNYYEKATDRLYSGLWPIIVTRSGNLTYLIQEDSETPREFNLFFSQTALPL